MEYSKDPFDNFNNAPLVLDLIFQHFNVQNLKSLSKVAPLYNNFISNSDCMKKIKIVVQPKFMRQQLRRKYQNVNIQKQVNIEDALKVLQSNSSWKCVEIFGINYIPMLMERGETHFRDIEELVLWDISNVTLIGFKYPQLNFDKLKTLKLTNCSLSVNELFIKSSRNLKKLSVRASHDTRKLLQLILDEPFRLEELHLSEHSTYNFDLKKQDLLNFLQVHAATLKVLILDIWSCVPVLKIVLCMPNLHKLQLFEMAKSHSCTNWDEVELPVNASIKDLQIEDLTDSASLLKCLLESCRKVVKLRVHQLNKEIFNVVSVFAPGVEEPESDWIIYC